jgi:hypothetical protein
LFPQAKRAYCAPDPLAVLMRSATVHQVEMPATVETELECFFIGTAPNSVADNNNDQPTDGDDDDDDNNQTTAATHNQKQKQQQQQQ